MVKEWVKKLNMTQSDVLIVSLCSVMTFPFLFSDIPKMASKIGYFYATFSIIILYFETFSTALIVVYGMLPYYLKTKKIFIFLLMLLSLLFIEAIIYLSCYYVLCNCDVKFNLNRITTQMQNNIIIAAPISMVLIIKRLLDSQNRALISEKEKKEAELKLLKQQIDPHFLFNNLNVLGVLIQKDTVAANEFLQRFSHLYRYLIRHKDDDVVLLEEELNFVQDYIYLLKQRFGIAYNFAVFSQLNSQNLPNRMVLPGAIQTLIENIIKHNQGEESNPLVISAHLDKDYFSIKNELRPKFNQPHSTKTGLKNLQTRYQLLTDKAVEIQQTESYFEVKVPFIQLDALPYPLRFEVKT